MAFSNFLLMCLNINEMREATRTPAASPRYPTKQSARRSGLKKDGCCCGATVDTPCKCMEMGISCSRNVPRCPCFALLHAQLAATPVVKKGKRATP